MNFNPRSPDGERLDFSHDIVNTPYQFQSTLPGWGATTQARETRDKQSISIHAPRMGSDGVFEHEHELDIISIHAPRMGSDRRDGRPRTRIVISIHAPRMGSDRRIRPVGCDRSISIHAPRMGSDKFLHVHLYPWQFQSTLPGWGATLEDLGYPISDEISIHAPRMGSDGTACCRVSADCNFNPRSPDGERLWAITGNYNAQVISIHAPRMGSD